MRTSRPLGGTRNALRVRESGVIVRAQADRRGSWRRVNTSWRGCDIGQIAVRNAGYRLVVMHHEARCARGDPGTSDWKRQVDAQRAEGGAAVSYTHLTLPTIYSV